MIYRSRTTIFFLYIFFALVYFSCARMGRLEGGKKDLIPPKLQESEPAMKATNFDGKRVRLTFNEFIQLKDVRKNLVISPPFKKFPEVVLRYYKDIIIYLEDSLKSNTTYTFYFGSAIVDNNEGNPLPNFNFVFSTGSYIDSLTLVGRVLGSFDHKPLKDRMFVMLYPVWNDTIPTKTLPAYVTKTNDDGWFTFNYIKADTFMIFALKDANMNYLYDMQAEEIAFADSLLRIDTSFFQPFDSASLQIQATDSIPIDSIDLYAGKKPQVMMYYFTETPKTKQMLLKYERPQPSKFSLVFQLPPTDTFHLSLVNPPVSGNWFIRDKNILNDSTEYWITDTSLLKKDTLQIRITYKAPDSLNNMILKNDTVRLIFKKPLSRGRKEAPRVVIPKLTLGLSTSTKQTVELNDTISMETSVPFDSIYPEKIMLFRYDDTIKVPVKYSYRQDIIHPRKIFFSFTFEPGTKYLMVADTAAIRSIYSTYNDSTGFSFETRRDDYYSIIKLNLKNVKGPIIVQVLDEKGNLVRESYTAQEGNIVFDFLAPGKYGLKIINDFNGNRRWDPGNWLKRLQPESVEFYNEEISLRSNWDKEINWILGQTVEITPHTH